MNQVPAKAPRKRLMSTYGTPYYVLFLVSALDSERTTTSLKLNGLGVLVSAGMIYMKVV